MLPRDTTNTLAGATPRYLMARLRESELATGHERALADRWKVLATIERERARRARRLAWERDGLTLLAGVVAGLLLAGSCRLCRVTCRLVRRR